MSDSMYFMYCIKPVDKDMPIKIGISNDPDRRLKDLQTGHPDKLEIAFTDKYANKESAERCEKHIHKHFASYQREGEWFDIYYSQVIGYIIDCVAFAHYHDQLGNAELQEEIFQLKEEIRKLKYDYQVLHRKYQG